jgi:hypothetical protein
MKKTSSLNHMTEVFFFFLFVIVCANIEDLYEPFLSFAKEGNTPFATMYGLELLAFVCGVAGIGRFVYNARKQRFFTKENYLLFYSMGIALFIPGFVHFIGQILGEKEVWKAFQIELHYWFGAGAFLFILAEIFRYGYRLKEEQELTI